MRSVWRSPAGARASCNADNAGQICIARRSPAICRLWFLGAEAIVGRFSTGQPVRRKEDQRFITGNGRYTDDITLDNQAYLYLFRSPYAHGVITTLDVAEARKSVGVVAVYTANDLTDAGIKDLIGADIPSSSLSEAKNALRQPPLARGRIRYVGEPVAGIVTESLAAARDAAE